MAEREIEIVIKARDLASGEVEEIIQKITKTGGQMGDQLQGASEKGSLAFKGFKFASKELFHEFGVGGPLARSLANEVENIGSKFGAMGMVFGTFGIVAIATYGIVKHFTEEKKKLREELDRNISALKGEVAALYENKLETLAVKEATFALGEAKRIIMMRDLQKRIADETEAYQKQRTEIERLSEWLANPASRSEIPKSEYEKFLKRQREDSAVTYAQLKADRALMAALGDKPDVTPGSNKYSLADRTTSEAQYLTAIDALWATENQTYQGRLDMKLAILDAHNEAELQKLSAHGASAAQLADTFAVQQINREATIAAQTRQMNQQTEQNKIAVLQSAGNAMGMMYDVTGRKMKMFFILQKGMAAAEAFIQYTLAAAKAVGQGGIWGIPFSSYFTAMSYLTPALIMASAFTGPSGGGGAAQTGGIPTVSSGGTEGIPSGGGGAITYQTNITIMNPLDGADVQRTVEQWVIPALNDAEARNVH